MMKLLPLSLVFCLNVTLVAGQSIKEKILQNEGLAKDENTKAIFANYVLDSIIGSYQRALTGYQVEAGKLIGTSATITEKGGTININLLELSGPDKINTWYLGSTIGLAGDDKFSSVFKKGRYHQTLTAGLTFNYFPALGTTDFAPAQKQLVKAGIVHLNQIRSQPLNEQDTTDLLQVNATIRYIRQSLATLEENLKFAMQIERKTEEELKTLTGGYDVQTIISKGKTSQDTLLALSILPKHFGKLSTQQQKAIVDTCIAHYKDYHKVAKRIRKLNYLAKAETLQMNIPYNAISLQWWTFKVNYNNKPYQIIDYDLPEDNYLRSHNDHFASGSVGYTYTRLIRYSRQIQWTLSPITTFSYARQFDESNQITIARYTPLTGDTLVRQVLESKGYPEIASSKVAIRTEIPFIFLWSKSNFGFEIALRGGCNDPNKDNYGARLGLYVPVQIKDGTPIWIQPVFQLGKLFEKDIDNFWQDNVSFGFNLSVALKKMK